MPIADYIKAGIIRLLWPRSGRSRQSSRAEAIGRRRDKESPSEPIVQSLFCIDIKSKIENTTRHKTIGAAFGRTDQEISLTDSQ